MEKYSKWRDPGTGIHPFLPNKGEPHENLLWNILVWVKCILIGPVIAVARLPFITVVFLWLLLFSSVAQIIPIAFARRFLKRFNDVISARVLLWLLGFWWIETKITHISRQKRGDIRTQSPGSTIKSGDLILANHISYVDVLYFTFRFSPLFTAVPNTWKDESPKGTVINRGLLGALVDSVNFPPHKDGQPLPDIALRAKNNMDGPVVVFPEGTTTNGRTVLAAVPALATKAPLPEDCKIHVVGIKYEYRTFSPSYTVGSVLWHFLRLISQVHNELEVRYLSEADVPPLPLDSSDRKPTLADREEWSDAVHRTLGAVLQMRKVTLNTLDKREFLDYWYSHKKTYKGS